jgi:hypothetical protein
MKRSDSIKELAAALAKAQGLMGDAKKDSTNPFFKSKYADLASVIDAIKSPLSENGLSYMQFPIGNEKEEIGVETLLAHSSGEWIMGDPFFIPVNKADAQGYGSAITYVKRYSLQAIIGVPSDDDDDGNSASKNTPPSKISQMLLSKWTESAHSASDVETLKAVWIDGTKEFKEANDSQGAAHFRKVVTNIGETIKSLAKEQAEALTRATIIMNKNTEKEKQKTPMEMNAEMAADLPFE